MSGAAVVIFLSGILNLVIATDNLAIFILSGNTANMIAGIVGGILGTIVVYGSITLAWRF